MAKRLCVLLASAASAAAFSQAPSPMTIGSGPVARVGRCSLQLRAQVPRLMTRGAARPAQGSSHCMPCQRVGTRDTDAPGLLWRRPRACRGAGSS